MLIKLPLTVEMALDGTPSECLVLRNVLQHYAEYLYNGGNDPYGDTGQILFAVFGIISKMTSAILTDEYFTPLPDMGPPEPLSTNQTSEHHEEEQVL